MTEEKKKERESEEEKQVERERGREIGWEGVKKWEVESYKT